MAVYENSRYLHTLMFNRLGFDRMTFDVRKRFNFNEQNFEFYVWNSTDTLDGLAYKYYRNCALRWAILDANPQYRTEFDIQSGDIINIPSYEEILEIVNV